MALKLSIGFQKKIGLPDYGSVGANCQVDFEIDHSLLDKNLDGFHEKAQRAFSACQQAVGDQLARQSPHSAAKNGNGHSNGHKNGESPPGNGSSTNGGNGNGHSRGASRLATQSQARAIRAIASKQRVDLQQLLEARFGVGRPEALCLSDASTLIDDLKNPSDGGQR
jgi:hypothetical protein